MPRPLVILHGYSDTSETFAPLAAELVARLGVQPDTIALGDYITLNDYVAYPDLLAALDQAWTDHNLPRDEGAVDMVVHSTGALVARQWLHWLTHEKATPSARGSTPEPCPVKHLCMLAPANFGSPLAHKGLSFIGRVIKGSQPNADGPLQSGKYILKGLELASPFTWSLAFRDRMVPLDDQLYKKGRCLCTVLVGDQGYSGLAAMANEDGGDGTVRISTANMNCAALSIDFTQDPQNPAHELKLSSGRTAFGLISGFNHATITGSGLKGARLSQIVDLVTDALTVTDAKFDAWCNTLQDTTEENTTATRSFQNTVVHCVDDQGPGGRPVADFIVEFFENDTDKDGGFLAELFHTRALENVHNFSDDTSFRSLYVNCAKLIERIDKKEETLHVSVNAHPQLSETHARVGFETLTDAQIGSVAIPADAIRDYFTAHRTLLTTIRLKWHRGNLFRYRGSDAPYTPL